MNNQTLFRVVIAIVGLALLGGVIWVASNIEVVTENKRGYNSEAAIRDDFLALTKILDRLQIKNTRLSRHEDFWDYGYAGVITAGSVLDDLSDADATNLKTWLSEDGAHLILLCSDVLYPKPKSQVGLWLQELGIKLLEAGTNGSSWGEGQVTVPGRAEALATNWGYGPEIDIDPTKPALLTGRQGKVVRLIQVPVGKGSLTICTDANYLSNEGLRETGHAALLSWLPLPAKGEGSIGILKSLKDFSASAGLPWGSLLLPLGLFLLLLVWAKAPRFGPPIELKTEGRRSLRERFTAEGSFVRLRGTKGFLESIMRESFLKFLAKKLPQVRGRERLAMLSQLSGEKAQYWDRLLHDKDRIAKNTNELLSNLNSLEKMRRKL